VPMRVRVPGLLEQPGFLIGSAEVDPDTGQVIASHAEVAETTHTAFSGTDRVTARLIVRRVRRLRPRAGQLELDTHLWRHHGIFTDRVEPLLQAEGEHRGHAIVEQVIADLKAGPLAHCPGRSTPTPVGSR